MKKGFKFRLNKVLEVKDVEFKQQQKDLSDASHEKRQAYQQLLEKQSSTESFEQELDNISLVNAGDMRLQYGHFHSLLDEVEHHQQQVTTLAEREDQEREKLLKVQRERKVLEKLREKELERFRQDYLRQSQNEIDELAVMGARRIATAR